MLNLTPDKRQLCDIQGRLFEDAGAMEACWSGFHTLDVEMAIDDLKELCRQNHA